MSKNPMQPLCGAHCRTTGQPCKNYPMPNGRCRMHGGKSTGRPIISGLHTKNAKAQRRQLGELLSSARKLIKDAKHAPGSN